MVWYLKWGDGREGGLLSGYLQKRVRDVQRESTKRLGMSQGNRPKGERCPTENRPQGSDVPDNQPKANTVMSHRESTRGREASHKESIKG